MPTATSSRAISFAAPSSMTGPSSTSAAVPGSVRYVCCRNRRGKVTLDRCLNTGPRPGRWMRVALPYRYSSHGSHCSWYPWFCFRALRSSVAAMRQGEFHDCRQIEYACGIRQLCSCMPTRRTDLNCNALQGPQPACAIH